MKNNSPRDLANQQALIEPKPGDYWHEMFCPYFIVVNQEGDKFRVLSCMGGPNSYNRKHELNAKIDGREGWHFDYSKSMVVDREWMSRAVRYDSIDGFVADVVNSEKTQTIVAEWRDYMQKELRRKIESAQDDWERFTGWKYLKEPIA